MTLLFSLNLIVVHSLYLHRQCLKHSLLFNFFAFWANFLAIMFRFNLYWRRWRGYQCRGSKFPPPEACCSTARRLAFSSEKLLCSSVPHRIDPKICSRFLRNHLIQKNENLKEIPKICSCSHSPTTAGSLNSILIDLFIFYMPLPYRCQYWYPCTFDAT